VAAPFKKTISGKIYPAAQMPLATFTNPLANELQGDAKKCNRARPRVTRLQLPILLIPRKTTLDQSPVSPLDFFHLPRGHSFTGGVPFVARVEVTQRTGAWFRNKRKASSLHMPEEFCSAQVRNNKGDKLSVILTY
jgi:hypothetical protein